MTWSTIVVGTDGSPTATRAVSHAAELAAALSATLVVVTAYSESGPGASRGGGTEPVPAGMEWTVTASAGAEERARGGADQAGAAGARDVRTRTGPGEPTAVLLRVASEVDAGLIVVGSKGMTSATRFVTGSVPNSLSHHADRDVLIVRTD